MTPRTRFTAALLALVVLTLSAGASPAAAHGGEGQFTVEAREPRGSGFRYVVRLIWTDDGHAALDATVTATVVAADGTPQTPVTLNPLDQDGRYAAVVASPGGAPYTVRFTAVTPEATAEITQQPPPTTTVTTQPSPPTTDAPSVTSTTLAADEAKPHDDDENADAEEQGDEGGNSSLLFFVVALAAVALIVVPIVLQRRRTTP